MLKFNSGKKIFFYSVLIVLPLLILVLLELSLRLFSFGDDLSLFVDSSDARYFSLNQAVGKRYFSKFENTTPLNDVFLKEKPANGYRIFVLGESTVQGFPYDANVAFSRILHKRLQDIFPNRTIEVVNLGMTAINSYTLLDFSDELLDQKPDAVLIYTGHNEYYGAMGVGSMESGTIPAWLKKLHLSLIHLKTYQLLQKCISGIYSLISPVSEDEAKGTLMQRLVGKNIVPYKSEKYFEGLNQFKENMSSLLEKFKEAHVSVIISDLVSNEKDLQPFYSMHSGSYPPADKVFWEARKLEGSRLYKEAKEKYITAKDLDAIRFRAPEDINSLIVKIADSLGAYRFSLKTIFENNSPNKIVGDNLMTEHLHPNIEGYFLMADGFFNALKEHGMIEKDWDTSRIKPWQFYRQNWGFTELDSSVAALRIKNLKSGWPFKPAASVNNFIFTYQPANVVDSIAFMNVKYDNVSTEKIHKDLAAYYKLKGDMNKASKEYLSLAYSYPQNSSFFYQAAELANISKDYDNTIRILLESPNPDTSSYVQLTLASIFYEHKNYKGSLISLNKLQGIHLSDENFLLSQKLKYNVLKDSGLINEAEKILASIKKVDPTFNENKKSKTLLVLVPDKIKPYIENAEKLRRRGRLQEALDVLNQANNIKETPYTNLLIGKILLAQNRLSALTYMEKAYKDIKDDPSLIYNLTLLYMMSGDFPKAKTTMSDFAKLEGENDPKYKQLQSLYKISLEKKNKPKG